MPSTQFFADPEVVQELPNARAADVSRKASEKEKFAYNTSSDFPTTYGHNGRNVNGVASRSVDGYKLEMKNTYGGFTSQKNSSSFAQNSADVEENIQKVSPPRRKISSRGERTEKLGNWFKKEGAGLDPSTMNHKTQSTSAVNSNNAPSWHYYEPESLGNDGNIDAILEVGFPRVLSVPFLGGLF